VGKKSKKGGAFERLFCKLLSRWWTGGEREDVFWRSQNSGGRATVRRASGRQTFGQHGDVAATHPCGVLLLDLLTVECKRGYNANSVADLIDRLPGRPVKKDSFEAWLLKAVRDAEAAGSFSWLLVVRRDKRRAVAYFPALLAAELRRLGCWKGKPRPTGKACVTVEGMRLNVCWMLLDDFLICVTPDHVRKLCTYC
jgi:hypothetical protein